MKKFLILVDENDKPVGKMEKLRVHEQGLLHRAFSVFIFNKKGELLLQQRATDKYHSAGLWSNTCCSHPQFGEDTKEAAVKRLEEEMSLQCKLEYKFKFIYKSIFENGLTEHELDHVYFGITDDLPGPDKTEVKSWKYINVEKLEKDIAENPQSYTDWLRICLQEVKSHLKEPCS